MAIRRLDGSALPARSRGTSIHRTPPTQSRQGRTGLCGSPPRAGQSGRLVPPVNFSNTSIWDYGVMPEGAITAGPDGALWFTNGANSIGRMTTNAVFSLYSDPGISYPSNIAVGPDGALWFSNINSVGRITTGGVVTDYPNPDISYPGGIAAGPDGALWFTNTGNNSIGRITTSGVVSAYVDSEFAGPNGIDGRSRAGALWFTNTGNNSIGRDHRKRGGRRLHRNRHERPAGYGGRAGWSALVHQLYRTTRSDVSPQTGVVTNYQQPRA